MIWTPRGQPDDRASQMTGLLVLCAGIVGLAVGSFLNVVIHRVPRHQSVSRPRSACPGCRAEIAPRDNIPVVSWVLLRGRCRRCGEPISIRYPAVESLTAVLFVAVALRFGDSWTLPVAAAFVAGLVALAFCDLEHFLLPKRIVYPTLVICAGFMVAGAATSGDWKRLAVAAACGLGAFAIFFLVNFANPAWLGFGDVRLAGLLGMALGWLGVSYLVAGILVANLVGVAVIGALIAAGRAKRKTPVPYGVFLSLGAIVAVFAGGPIGHLLFYRPGG